MLEKKKQQSQEGTGSKIAYWQNIYFFRYSNVQKHPPKAEVKRKQEAEEKFKKWLEAKNQARKAERERRDKQVLKERKENEMKKQISEAKFKEWLRYV